MFDFLINILGFLNGNQIQYMLSGSVAMSTYVLPRATRDFDFIVHLEEKDIDKLLAHFQKGFYCDAGAVKDAVARKSMFNIIDHKSGFKADFMILKNQPFRKAEFERRKLTDFQGTPMFIVSPEDLLISKLIWIQEIQSHIQIDDIKNLASLKELDWEYIRQWVDSLRLVTFNLLP